MAGEGSGAWKKRLLMNFLYAFITGFGGSLLAQLPIPEDSWIGSACAVVVSLVIAVFLARAFYFYVRYKREKEEEWKQSWRATHGGPKKPEGV